MHLKSCVLTIVTLGIAITAHASESVLSGKAFPTAGGSAPLFNVELALKEERQKRVCSQLLTDRAGKVIASTKAIYESGRLSSISFEQRQSRETALIEIKDGKVFYSHTKDGKTNRSTKKDSGDLVPFSAVPYFIVSKWDEIKSGKTTEFKVPIPERLQAIAIRVSKERTWTQMGRRYTEFKMEPSNAIFRALVEPDYYVFDDQSKTLIEHRGRTDAKTGAPGNLDDFTGRIVYRPLVSSGK
ncbi:hypothetical protein V6x_42110 [Gimesia chilikensis]|uniref:Uncharacterized protein n=1 Tax=Gimesia chilikensis TaxID=2605989 RepID=A0A517WGV7_9PLAN|nr:hypothetical protein [Gimesia chilikensis]QDU04483.1 hypothetical protein V6x_42110 [Gimesia chilikensis]